MTNDQIIKKIQEITENQIRTEVEMKQMNENLNKLQEGVEVTRQLAEDIHIMAINMENMQKSLDNTIKKVEAVEKKDYNNYLESKKVIKNHVLSGLTGAGVTGIIGVIVFILTQYISKGGA